MSRGSSEMPDAGSTCRDSEVRLVRLSDAREERRRGGTEYARQDGPGRIDAEGVPICDLVYRFAACDSVSRRSGMQPIAVRVIDSRFWKSSGNSTPINLQGTTATLSRQPRERRTRTS